MESKNPVNKQRGSIVLVLVLLVAGAVLVTAGFFAGRNLNFKGEKTVFEQKVPGDGVKEIVKSVSLKFDPVPDVDFKSFPLIVDKKLALLPLPDYGKELIDTGIEDNASGSGASNFGSSSPTVSPDLKKIAFIKDRTFWIISSDGKHKSQFPKELEAEYITGWSPDSKKLIVYSPVDSAKSMFEGYGMTYEKKFNPEKLPGGYYLADMEDGTLMLLEVVNEFVSWAGPDRLLISVSYPRQDRYPQENYVLFDLRSFAADAKTLEGKFDEYFGKQFSFNSDGRKWALSLGNTENSPGGSSSNMIVADFPKTEGVTIGQGTWAEYQGPILSPDGNKLIFVNHTPPSGWYTKLWDGKDVKLFTSGRPEMWVDNNSFIMTDVRYDGEKQIYSVYLYDIPSSKETKLY